MGGGAAAGAGADEGVERRGDGRAEAGRGAEVAAVEERAGGGEEGGAESCRAPRAERHAHARTRTHACGGERSGAWRRAGKHSALCRRLLAPEEVLQAVHELHAGAAGVARRRGGGHPPAAGGRRRRPATREAVRRPGEREHQAEAHRHEPLAESSARSRLIQGGKRRDTFILRVLAPSQLCGWRGGGGGKNLDSILSEAS